MASLLRSLTASAESILEKADAKAEGAFSVSASSSFVGGASAPVVPSSAPVLPSATSIAAANAEARQREVARVASRGAARMQALEEQIGDLYAELQESRRTADALRARLAQVEDGRIEDLEGELQLAQRRLEVLQTDYDGARGAHAAAIAAARAEIARAESALEAAAVEGATLRAAFGRKEEALAADVARLSVQLAEVQSRLEAAEEARDDTGGGAGSGTREKQLNIALAAARESASIAIAELQSEGRKLAEAVATSDVAKRQAAKWREQAEAANRDIAVLRASTEERSRVMDREARALAERLALAEANAPALREQLRTVTSRLTAGDDARQRLNAEVNALKRGLEQERLLHENCRSELTELRAREAERGDGDDVAVRDSVGRDAEAGFAGGFGGRELRSRRNGGTGGNMTPMTKLKSFSDKGHMQDVGRWLDSFAAWVGRLLRSSPSTRLVFIVWVGLLHLWTGFLLLFHVHGLSDDHHLLKKPHS
jgi:chromosome segregation ATPase